MTERKPREMSVGSWIDQQIAEAARRGAFDDLPGAGKPIPRRSGGTEAWLQDYLRREGVSADELLPIPLRLRKEAERLTATVQDLPSEDAVREVVRDLNRRIHQWRRLPTGPPVYLRLVDEEAMVARWRDAQRARPAPAAGPPRDTPSRRRWWRRRRALRPGVPQRPRRQFGPVGQPQLGQGAAYVPLDGPLGQHQPAGDRPVGEAVRDEHGDLPFAPGQRIAGPDGLLELAGQAHPGTR